MTMRDAPSGAFFVACGGCPTFPPLAPAAQGLRILDRTHVQPHHGAPCDDQRSSRPKAFSGESLPPDLIQDLIRGRDRFAVENATIEEQEERIPIPPERNST
jgi:hypothetical protein